MNIPNGTVQIRKYSSPVGADSSTKCETETEPFSETKARVIKDFGNSEENQRKSLAHTHSMINTYARCYSWGFFGTFTYDPEKIDRYNFKLCMNKIRNWLKNQRRLAPDLKYLAVPEMHRDGAWHLHVLLADTGQIKFEKSGKRYLGMDIYNLSGWKWGFSTATKIQDTFRIQNYISKYITKESHALSKHAHRYYVSRNLPKPKESIFFVEPDEEKEFLEELIDSLGVELKYTKEIHNDFTDVTYMELY